MQDENSFNNTESTNENNNQSNSPEKSFEKKNNSQKTNLNIILTIINAVLFIGLIVLYFIVLKPGNALPEKAMKKASQGDISIAYVNSDTLLAKYDMVKKMREQLEKNSTALENELKSKQSAFEKDAAYFQDQVNKKTISEASAQEIYGNLMAEQQKLYELREKYSADLARQEFDMNQLLLDSLNNFLGRYNTKMNFDYIFSYSKGGNILKANDSLDITHEVLKLLNEEFKGEK